MDTYWTGQGGAHETKLLELSKLLSTDEPAWFHFDYSLENFSEWLSAPEGIFDEWMIEAMTDEQTRPRSLVHKETLYTCLRSINFNENQSEEDMVSIRVLIRNNLIITARKRESIVVDSIQHALQRHEGPTSPSEVLCALIEEIGVVVSDHINYIVDEVDDAEQEYLTSFSELKRDEISVIRRKILLLKRHLTPQVEALKFLYASQYGLLSDLKPELQEQHIANTRFLEDLDLARERCTLLQEQINNRLNELINKRMYIFAMITTVFLPISTVAGLFGMNLGGMPGTDANWAFAFVSTSLVLIAIVIIFLLRRKHWF